MHLAFYSYPCIPVYDATELKGSMTQSAGLVRPACRTLYNRREERHPAYSQTMKPNITPASPMLIPAISLPPFAVPFVGDAEAPVAEPVFEAVAVAEGALRSRVWPTVGNATFPFTSQPFDVDVGQAGRGCLEAEAE